MNVHFYIAKRFLFAKKSFNIINIISRISILGVAFGTAALVIVLSAFNGLQGLVENLYAQFDPDIKITIVEGKSFSVNDFPVKEIQKMPHVEVVSQALEEVALFKYQKNQTIGTVKGVDDNFAQLSGVDSAIISGKYLLTEGNFNYAVLGYGIAEKLNLNVHDLLNQLWIIVPKRGLKKSLNPMNDFRRKRVIPAGIFGINPDFDDKYVLTSISVVQRLLKKDSTQVSSIEIKALPNTDLDQLKKQIQTIVGEKFSVKTRFELNELLYKTNKTEKWITFFILSFILIIATFNIIASMAMLILDKKSDFVTYKSLGLSQTDIKKIFFYNGMLINIIGAGVGIILGTTFSLLQQYVGLIPLEGGIVEYYPVKVMWTDFIFIIAIVMIIGSFASWYPVRFLKRTT